MLAGAVVFADRNADGALTAGETSRTVRGNGRYRLPGIQPGPTRVCLVPSAGFALLGTDRTPANGATFGGVTLPAFRRATIKGRIFDDNDRNGVRDATDTAVAGITVFLDQNGNGALDTAERSRLSNTNGVYRFRGLAPGRYQVSVVVPVGFEPISPAAGGAQVVVASGATSQLSFALDQAGAAGPGVSGQRSDTGTGPSRDVARLDLVLEDSRIPIPDARGSRHQ